MRLPAPSPLSMHMSQKLDRLLRWTHRMNDWQMEMRCLTHWSSVGIGLANKLHAVKVLQLPRAEYSDIFITVLLSAVWGLVTVMIIEVLQALVDMDEEAFGLGTQLAAEMLTGLVDEVPSTSKPLK